MKKIMSLMLSLLMIFAIGVAAAEGQVVNRGDTLSMEVRIASASGTSAKIGIRTNGAPVTFAGAVGGSANDTVPPKGFDGYFVVVNISGLTLKPDGSNFSGGTGGSFSVTSLQSGVVGTLSFTVNANAPAGEYTVEVYSASGSSTVAGSLTFQVKDAATGDRLPGDVNGDQYVDLLDYLAIKKYFGGYNVAINEPNANVNGDEYLDLLDMLLLKKYFGGYDVVLK